MSRNRIITKVSAVLATITLILSPLTSIFQVSADAIPVYDDMAIDARYSGAISTMWCQPNQVQVRGATYLGKKARFGRKGDMYEYRNVSKMEDHYMLFPNCATKDGKYYDLKLYVWTNTHRSAVVNTNGWIGDNLWELAGNRKNEVEWDNNQWNRIKNFTGSGRTFNEGSNTQIMYTNRDLWSQAHFEIAILEHGTNKEVQFGGQVAFTDIDGHQDMVSEAYQFHSGTNVNNVARTRSSNIIAGTNLRVVVNNGQWETMDGKWFRGSVSDDEDNTAYERQDYSNLHNSIFVCFDTGPTSRFSYSYMHRDNATMMLCSPTYDVNYQYRQDGGAYKTWKNTKVSKYVTLNPQVHAGQPTVTGYDWNGWYGNANLTGGKITNTGRITSNRTYYGELVKKKFKVTTGKEHATITPTKSGIVYGTSHKVTWNPDAGYYLESGKIDNTTMNANQLNAKSYTFSDIQANHSISVRAVPYRKITTSQVNSTITNTITNIKNGESKTVTWNPDAGYHLVSGTIDGKALTAEQLNKKTYTFSNIQADHTVHIESVPNYKVTTQITGGTIDPVITNIEPGQNKTINFRANKDHEIVSITVDGKPQGITDKLKGTTAFNNIQADHTVVVVAKPKSELYHYSISTQGINAQITPTEQNIPWGENRSVTYTPNEHYHFKSLVVDNKAVPISENDESGSQSFNHIEADHSVIVEAEPDYNITTYGENVEITEPQEYIKPHEKREITWKPVDDTYEVISVEVDGTPMEDFEQEGIQPFEDIVADHDVKVIATKKPLVTTEIDHGIITPEAYITLHDDATVEAIPEVGYQIQTVIVDGEEVEFQDPQHYEKVFEDVVEDHHVQVITEKIPALSITKTADATKALQTEQIRYTIVIQQTGEDAIAKEVVLTDALPKDMTLVKNSIKVIGIEDYELKEEKGKFVITIPELEYNKPVSVDFYGQVPHSLKETRSYVNVAIVEAKNDPHGPYEAKTKDTIIYREPVEQPATGLIPNNPAGWFLYGLLAILMACMFGLVHSLSKSSADR